MMSGIPGSQRTPNNQTVCSPESSGAGITSLPEQEQWLSGLDNTTQGSDADCVVFAYMVRGHVRSVEQHWGCAQQPDGVNVFPRHCRPSSICTALGAPHPVRGFDSCESSLASNDDGGWELIAHLFFPRFLFARIRITLLGFSPRVARHPFTSQNNGGDWSCKW